MVKLEEFVRMESCIVIVTSASGISNL